MRALVVHGSKMGGTKGLAEMVGQALGARGFEVVVRPAAEVATLEHWDLVVVGGALYAARWHRDARRFVRRHRRGLQDLPVWFFSSGPLDDSATARDIPPVRGVQSLMRLVGAQGHATFGGRLPADPPGFMARSMARKLAGDWRDAGHVERWVEGIVSALRPEGVAPWR